MLRKASYLLFAVTFIICLLAHFVNLNFGDYGALPLVLAIVLLMADTVVNKDDY